MKKQIILSNIVIVCIICLFLAGCASSTKIMMTQEKYSPSFRAGDYGRYKGKKLVLSSFSNQAQNTKAYDYFSTDKKYMYEGNASLENYYLYCFQKAFRHIGVSLVDYNYDGAYNPYHHGYWWGAPGPGAYRAPKGVLEFQFILLSITDQEFKFKVLLFKNGESKLDKEYTVTMDAAGTDNAGELEKRSYRLVDLAFTTIMRDRDFQKLF
jgi:hypothetical protein